MTKFEAMTTGSSEIDLKDITTTVPHLDRVARVGFDPEELLPKRSAVEVGIEKLTALCHAVGMKDKTAEITKIFREMTGSWGDRSIWDKSAWKSDVSDDCSPFEFSIAFKENRAELRILLEAQGTEPTLQSNWQAGLKLNQYLADNFDVNLDRFRQIEDLFVPNNPDAKLGMWHSACFYPDKEPAFKLYLSPHSKGTSLAAAVVEESLLRLGFPHSWSTLAEVAAQRGPDKDEFAYFSLDLANSQSSRVKVYLRHYDAKVEDIERALSAASNYVAGEVTKFCQVMAAGQNSFSAKPVTTCFAWVKGDDLTPSGATFYLPISNYATDDCVVRDGIDRYFNQHGLPVAIYHSAIQAFSARPLAAGIGMHSYLALRQERQQRTVTVYLNPEVNSVRAPRTPQPAKALPSLEEMAWHYEEYSLAHHPFLQRLQREPVNPQHLWLVLMNLRPTSSHFTRRLANVVARIDDERIRCILAKQLNDELGNGQIDGIHRKLFERLMSVVESWRMESFTTDMLQPGERVSERFEEIFLGSNPCVGVGAIIVMEIYGKQFDLWLGEQLRQTDIDLAEISWVTLHEELEIDHANESIFLARFVAESEDGLVEARQGIEKAYLAAYSFLNGLYRLCFN